MNQQVTVMCVSAILLLVVIGWEQLPMLGEFLCFVWDRVYHCAITNVPFLKKVTLANTYTLIRQTQINLENFFMRIYYNFTGNMKDTWKGWCNVFTYIHGTLSPVVSSAWELLTSNILAQMIMDMCSIIYAFIKSVFIVPIKAFMDELLDTNQPSHSQWYGSKSCVYNTNQPSHSQWYGS